MSVAPQSRLMLDVRGLSEHTDNRFRWALGLLADRLGIDPDWLTGVMSVESAGTFDPAIRNPNGGATGLIQFMPDTATRLGTTTAELAAMTQVEQLVYVEKYLKPFAGRMLSPDDVYLVIFYPAATGKGPDNLIATRADGDPTCQEAKDQNLDRSAKVYACNRGFDRDKDGRIFNAEVGATVRGVLARAEAKPRLVVTEPTDEEPGAPGESETSSTGVRIGMGGRILAAAVGLGLAYWGTQAWMGGRRRAARASR